MSDPIRVPEADRTGVLLRLWSEGRAPDVVAFLAIFNEFLLREQAGERLTR